MKRTLTITFVAAAGLAVWGTAALTAPTPLEVPTDWELELTFPDPLVPVRFKVPGSDEEKTFWYFRFTVSNPTDNDRIYIPDFVLYADTGQLLRSGSGVPTGLFKKIQKIYNDPLLSDMNAITGKLLQGDDNARNGVAIFADIDPNATAFDLFVGGLSGETAVIALPKPLEVTETDAEGKVSKVLKDKITVVKTLQLHYRLPGEAAARFLTKPRLAKKTWVMR
ncbi:MAG TPA: hypothetical protein VMZ50_11875 [Phycisphaerae bacterium]|nr:hypothetical protein [Phycisphaerae bacterium]